MATSNCRTCAYRDDYEVYETVRDEYVHLDCKRFSRRREVVRRRRSRGLPRQIAPPEWCPLRQEAKRGAAD
jgi:hypothetical protein